MSKKNSIWPRPVIIPAPIYVRDIETPLQSINGTWQLCLSPSDRFWEKNSFEGLWQPVPVPSTLAALGIRPENNREYAYKTTLRIPSDFANRHIVIRFSAVNCKARVWIDGHFIRSHYGGFNSWDADIGPYVTAGCQHELTVGVTDCVGTISQFHYGGIIRDVTLMAVPRSHFQRFHVLTDLDSQYKNGTMILKCTVASPSQNAIVTLTLSDPGQKEVVLPVNTFPVTDSSDIELRLPVEAPLKWDAEHPRLYCLRASLMIDGRIQETVERRFGFRKIERKEDQVFINGMEIKLRGVDREEVHPLTGRTLSKEDIEQDVRLFKEANVNFVRTSHYNPTQYFLDLCDEYGLYVEEETSVSFVGQGQAFTNDDPEYLSCYLDQFAEMIEMDLTRPCIILWSLGNESMWGRNLRAELEYARAVDPGRLTIFSYPITLDPQEPQLDVWSAHYAEWYNSKNLMSDNNKSANIDILQSLGAIRYPVLHDEYIHPPCYNHLSLAKDQGSRDFWGESVSRFWNDIFHTKGALGGAIWNGIDEVWLCPDHTDEIFEWGIIDGYRREKPEHWHTKKAYSPVYISVRELDCTGDLEISVPVENRYDHTNLQEIQITCLVGNECFQFMGPDISPHTCGELLLPRRNWNENDVVTLRFQEKNGLICDIYQLPVHQKTVSYPAFSSTPVSVHEDVEQILVTGDGFQYQFEKVSGQFSLYCGEEKIITKGLWLHLDHVVPETWNCESFTYQRKDAKVHFYLTGSYDSTAVTYHYTIDGTGLIRISYRITKLPDASLSRQKLDSYGFDAGGYREAGVALELSDCFDFLEWEKDTKWAFYPEYHIGRGKGTAVKHRQDFGQDSYRQLPHWPWKDDMANYALFGKYDHGLRATKDFTSLKTNLYHACVSQKKTGAGIEILSDGSDSLRLEWNLDENQLINDDDKRILYKGTWKQHIDCKCYRKTETRSNQKGDSLELTFEGTGITWIAKQDNMYGLAQVYVDSRLAEPKVSLMPWGGIGFRPGAQSLHREPVFTVSHLPYGTHHLRIVVLGEPGDYWGYPSSNCYVSVDSFLVLGNTIRGNLKMIVDQEYNYPDLAWGNYVKEPILLSPGYQGEIYLRPIRPDS